MSKKKTDEDKIEELRDKIALEKAAKFLDSRATVKKGREEVGVSNTPGIKQRFDDIVRKVRERGGEAKK